MVLYGFLFSQTRASIASVILDGSHKIDTVHGNDVEVASGVGILVHVKYARAVITIHRCNDRVMAIDLKFGLQHIRMISVFMPHAGYVTRHGIRHLEFIYD